MPVNQYIYFSQLIYKYEKTNKFSFLTIVNVPVIQIFDFQSFKKKKVYTRYFSHTPRDLLGKNSQKY